MSDFEDQLRDELSRREQEFVPSPNLPQRIQKRVWRRRRNRRLGFGALATSVVVVVAAGVFIAQPDSGDNIRTDKPKPTSVVPPPTTTRPRESTTTTAPPTTTTTTAPPDSTTTSTPPPAPPPIDANTPLSRSGIGAIRAGMTLTEAEAAAGVEITPQDLIGPGSVCGTATLAGTGTAGNELWLVTSLSDPAQPLMNAVIQSVQGGRSTVEGIAIGDPVSKMDSTYGKPTRSYEYPYSPGGQVFIYEKDGFAYSASTDNTGTVIELESGLPSGVGNLEGCA